MQIYLKILREIIKNNFRAKMVQGEWSRLQIDRLKIEKITWLRTIYECLNLKQHWNEWSSEGRYETYLARI